MSWGDDLERQQKREDRWFHAVATILMLAGLVLLVVNETSCHTPKPPVNPTPDADASQPAPPPPGQDPTCQAVCLVLKQNCSGVGSFCACDFVTDPTYSRCLLDATVRPQNEMCSAATACDHGK